MITRTANHNFLPHPPSLREVLECGSPLPLSKHNRLEPSQRNESQGIKSNARYPSASNLAHRCQTFPPLLGGPQCAKRKTLIGHLTRGGLGKPLGRGEGERSTDISATRKNPKHQPPISRETPTIKHQTGACELGASLDVGAWNLELKLRQPNPSASTKRCQMIPPLLGGEGRGEGERPTDISTTRKNHKHQPPISRETPTTKHQIGACELGASLDVGAWNLELKS